MPTNLIFKPRLTTAFPSFRPASAFPAQPSRIVPTGPSSCAAYTRTDFPVDTRPVTAAQQGKYVSSTHYARYVLWQGRQNSELIIASHGSRVVSSAPNNILPLGTALHFYGPDGASINTRLVDRAFMRDNVASRPYEIRSGGQAYPDYELSKIQVPVGKRKRGNETYNNVLECLPGYDLVTMEQLHDDGPHEHMLLSELIAHLCSQGLRYSTIHCFFCRSLRAGDLRRHPSLQQFAKPTYMVR